MARTSFLERNCSYPSWNRNYPKNSQKRGLQNKLFKNLQGITAVSLQKLTPDVMGYMAIYFNLHETLQM
jgi:hypothetical protein